MSRERLIDPGLFRSEQVMGLSVHARLLWVGIIVTADDVGRRRASPHSLKLDVFPGDGFQLERVAEWCDSIARAGLIRLYEDEGGDHYLDIPRWLQYQKLKYIKASRYPEFPGAGQIVPAPAKPARARQVQAGSGRSSLERGQGEERRGEEGEKKREAAPQPPPLRAAGGVGAHGKEPVDSKRHKEGSPPPARPGATGVDPNDAPGDDPPPPGWQRSGLSFLDGTAKWNGKGRGVVGVRCVNLARTHEGALLVLGHYFDVSRKRGNGKLKEPWAALGRRLPPGNTKAPSAEARGWALLMVKGEKAKLAAKKTRGGSDG